MSAIMEIQQQKNDEHKTKLHSLRKTSIRQFDLFSIGKIGGEKLHPPDMNLNDFMPKNYCKKNQLETKTRFDCKMRQKNP